MERKKEKMDEENRIFFMFVQIVTLARTKFFLKKPVTSVCIKRTMNRDCKYYRFLSSFFLPIRKKKNSSSVADPRIPRICICMIISN